MRLKGTNRKEEKTVPVSSVKFGLREKQLSALGVFLFLLFIALFARLQFNMISPLWVIISLFIVYLFFQGVLKRERTWLALPAHIFEKRLFKNGLLLRVLAVFLIAIAAQLTWGRPIFIGATDGMRYFRVAREVADVFWQEGIGFIYPHLLEEYGSVDDIGVPLVIGLLFALTTKSVILASLFIAFLGAHSVKFIYRTASLLFDQSTARLAGLMAAFLPLSLVYEAVLLKEAFVVFLSSFVVFLATKLIVRSNVSFRNILFLGLAVFAIFLFRSAAGAVIVASMLLFFLINQVRGNPMVSWLIGFFVLFIFVYILASLGQIDYIQARLEAGFDHGEGRISVVESRTTWANLGLGPVFLILSHFAPFPSLINLSRGQHDFTYYWVPGLIVWNILSFYALLGLWYMIKNQPRQKLMVLGYTIGYTLVLGITAMFTQVRLGWNIMPMMMIPAAVGLKNFRSMNIFYMAVAIAGLFILAWNIFRGIGRGVF